jgi:two-component sensor histidine kinase
MHDVEKSIGVHWDAARQLTLDVCEKGSGFPADVDFRRTNPLGLRAVGMLTEQVGGTITLGHPDGTTITLPMGDRQAEGKSSDLHLVD